MRKKSIHKNKNNRKKTNHKKSNRKKSIHKNKINRKNKYSRMKKSRRRNIQRGGAGAGADAEAGVGDGTEGEDVEVDEVAVKDWQQWQDIKQQLEASGVPVEEGLVGLKNKWETEVAETMEEWGEKMQLMNDAHAREVDSLTQKIDILKQASEEGGSQVNGDPYGQAQAVDRLELENEELENELEEKEYRLTQAADLVREYRAANEDLKTQVADYKESIYNLERKVEEELTEAERARVALSTYMDGEEARKSEHGEKEQELRNRESDLESDRKGLDAERVRVSGEKEELRTELTQDFAAAKAQLEAKNKELEAEKGEIKNELDQWHGYKERVESLEPEIKKLRNLNRLQKTRMVDAEEKEKELTDENNVLKKESLEIKKCLDQLGENFDRLAETIPVLRSNK